MEYQLKRSKRKTIAIYILPDGSVEVRAPLRTAQKQIDAFVDSKQDWIESSVRRMMEKRKKISEYHAADGEWFPYLGQKTEISNGMIQFGNQQIQLSDDESMRKKVIANALKKEARKRILPFAERIGSACFGDYGRIRLSSAKTRWGSCSGKNDINLSFRLIMLPEELIRYVIVHEFCHTIEHNHSAAFWRKVEEYLPGGIRLREKLRETEKEFAVPIRWLEEP